MALNDSTKRVEEARHTGGGDSTHERAVLRRRLALARDEIAHLSRQLAEARAQATAAPEAEPEAVLAEAPEEQDLSAASDATELQQEVDTLRRSLEAKDQVLEGTAQQCRHLEDALEGQSHAYEALNKELERKAEDLGSAREQLARLELSQRELQERVLELLLQRNAPAPPLQATQNPARKGVNLGWTHARATRLIGLAVLVLIVVIGSASIFLSRSQPPPLAGELPTLAEAPAISRNEPVPESEELASSPQGANEPNRVEPIATRQVRDRLRDGSPGPLMVELPGGIFTMGSRVSVPNSDESPPHEVRLEPFLIGAYEVTYDQYDRFVRATGGRSPEDSGWGRGRRPVIGVNWEDAVAYVNWFSRETDRRYRLPSEAEWEYAARAGTRTPYWWGFEVGKGLAVCFDCGSAWDRRSTAEVGRLPPNPFGLHDMTGNALEWVADCYHPDYKDAPTSGQAWLGENCQLRVARGGAFNKPAASMRSSSRHYFAPETRLNMLGFRLARDP